MPNHLLMVFVRNAELGKVKTRIAKTIGDRKALKIYKELLRHTFETIEPLTCTKAVFFSNNTPDYINDLNCSHLKFLQNGDDLGEKMKNAFQQGFGNNFQSIIIIGSDNYELTPQIIQKAFDSLKDSDIVIGPAFDGGYYLLGMNKLTSELFENINWSTDSVFNKTIRVIESLGFNYKVLEPLNDVDNIEDVKKYADLLKIANSINT